MESGSRFTDALSDITGGAVKLSWAIAPNRSADRKGHRYGLYSWISANVFYKHYLDFQYNGAYGDTNERAFKDIVETDLIAGYQGKFGDFTLKLNGLVNFYGNSQNPTDSSKIVLFDPDTPDVGTVSTDPENKLDNLSANANINYEDDSLKFTLGYRLRGYQSQMLFVKEGYQEEEQENQLSRQLGSVNTQRAFANVDYTLNDEISLGLSGYMQKLLVKKERTNNIYKDLDTMEFVIRAKAGYNLENLTGITSSVDGYIENSYVTEEADKYKRGSEEKNLILSEAGLRFAAQAGL